MFVRWILITAVCLVATACEGDFVADEPVRVCTDVAVQCRLADGPLGVCERRPCRSGEEPPCFVCTPQH